MHVQFAHSWLLAHVDDTNTASSANATITPSTAFMLLHWEKYYYLSAVQQQGLDCPSNRSVTPSVVMIARNYHMQDQSLCQTQHTLQKTLR